jgi:hypothetical protein
MVWRLLIGNHPTHGMGGYVSVPGIDVFAATKFQMMWSTQQEQLQIVQSGSFFVNGGDDDEPEWVTIGWPAMGFIPYIMIGCDRYELVFQYLSPTSGRVRRVTYSEARTTDWPSNSTTGYYMVTKTPKPF